VTGDLSDMSMALDNIVPESLPWRYELSVIQTYG
jgi:hypothetical protein